MSLLSDIQRELWEMQRRIDEVVTRYKRGQNRLADLEIEIEHLTNEASGLADQGDKDLAWLAKNMKPDDFASEFGYYPEGKR